MTLVGGGGEREVGYNRLSPLLRAFKGVLSANLSNPHFLLFIRYEKKASMLPLV